MKVALYARVSKAVDQTVENQFLQLRQWAKNTGHEIVGEWFDEISSRDLRPKKEELLRKLRLKEIDSVAFVALDRWGRNTTELVLEFEEAVQRGWCLISIKEGLSLDTAVGRMYAQLLAVFANFERDRIRERTLMGLERATKQGKIKGRHPVNCGCGKVLPDKTKHDGSIKPIRDEANQVIGWLYPDGSSKKVREGNKNANSRKTITSRAN